MMALLDQSNTPSQGINLSPMQRFMNRRSITLLPTTTNLLQPCVTLPETQQRNLAKKQKTQERSYNRAAKDLSNLKEGNVVHMKPTCTPWLATMNGENQLSHPAWKKGRTYSRD